ncbi:DUF3857 domain-containing protein [Dyadobacter psychrotolerans]|uniref:DUF3857 domain-containing protein n=1 Tax=Dyadobacter psychrotolerans TaxID=2541721 RepID=A0A4R5DFV0_9BACT|nr:DUF3857 domain-containing protein [Dyadobacter psychrotolerans]TDE12057.1 DUF3857 domain-containing protein [Dyadobacter psychrotolerans]
MHKFTPSHLSMLVITKPHGLFRVIRTAFVLILLLNVSFLAFSQEDFKPKLGFIDRPSLDMVAYPGDSTADAVYLYDYGNVRFSYDDHQGLVMIMDCWARIKILKESALDRASVSLSYYDGPSADKKERIYDLKGFTHNLEANQIVTTPLDKKSVKDEKSSDTYWTMKFNLPNVKKGSVIEYSYTKKTPLSVRDKPETWTFQGSIPFKWSEFRINIPAFLEYKMTMGGYLPLFINKHERVNTDVGHSKFNGDGMAYRFVVKDAPAFVNEPYITTARDYLSKIEFELSSYAIPGEVIKRYSQTWENVDRTLDQMPWFGGELRKSGYLKEIKEEIIKKTNDPEERLALAYTHIQNHTKWDGYTGTGSKEGVKKAYDNKKGNASDINLSLTTLLRELDLDSNPVILSTRSNGKIHQAIPLMESFNYVVTHVKIGEKEYLLDATQPYARMGLLPEYALNGSGRLIPKKGPGRFIELLPRDSKSKLEMISAEINPEEGTVKGSYTISYGGYEALSWREKYGIEKESVYHENLKKELPEWEVKNIAIKNKDGDLKGTVNIACDFSYEDDNVSEGLFYFNPLLVGRWGTNPLKSSERIYPLDFGSGISSSYIGSFKLPDGYALEEIPKSEVIALPEKGGRFAYQVSQTGNVIQVNSTIIVNKVHFMAEEYHDLKEFFERVVQKHAQPLVIKKKVN